MSAGRPWRSFAALLLAGAASCGGARPDPSSAREAAAAADRREALLARVLVAPDDVAAWLELAAEEDRAGRPSAALDALEQARLVRAPLGQDLDERDRQREARLLAARGRARLLRGAASALADLQKARAAGAPVEDGELLAAEVAAALAEARHSDARRRAAGLSRLRQLGERGGSAATARGALATASAAERAAWAAWLWERGAKRAAYDVLLALGARSGGAPPPGLGDAAAELWAEASAWWRPSWRRLAPIPAVPRSAARRCAVVPLLGAAPLACAPSQVVSAGARSTAPERDVLALPLDGAGPRLWPTADSDALVTMLVRGYLEGQLDDLAPALLRLIDLRQTTGSAEAELQARAGRALLLRLAGDTAAAEAALRQADAAPPATTSERLVLAYEHLVRGDVAGASPLLPSAGEEASAPAVLRLRAVAEALSAAPSGGAVSGALVDLPAVADRAAVRAALVATAWLDPSASEAELAERGELLLAIAARYRGDVAVARRRAADLVATSADAAAAWAQLGALYLLLDDPASARAAWQAAVDRSAEPGFLQGLALAAAAAKDPDAALVFMTSAAAASGDPAVVIVDVAEELLRAGSPVPALQAARAALELAPLERYAAALDVAVRAARALDRRDELVALEKLGAATATPSSIGDASSAAAMALASAAAVPRLEELLWISTRWNPRSAALRGQLFARLPGGDARRAVLVEELAALAGDADRPRRAAAVAALRALGAPPAP